MDRSLSERDLARLDGVKECGASQRQQSSSKQQLGSRDLEGWVMIALGLICAAPFFYTGTAGRSPYLWMTALAVFGGALLVAGVIAISISAQPD